MPFIPMNLNDAVEAKPVPHGKYDVVIAACEITKTKEKQKDQFRVQLAIEGHDDAPNVFEYVQIPDLEDEAKSRDFKALLLRRFLTLFGVKIDPAGFDPEPLAMELVGARANVELKQEEYPVGSGTMNNKLVVPRLKAEESPGSASAGRGSPPPKRRAA